jgi:CBS domain-containing protein
VSGLSGSGKSIALNVLEDAGYYCVDNLPAKLLLETVDFLAESGHERAAVSIDARSSALPALPEAIERLRGEEALPNVIPYLYAVESDDAPTLLGMVRLRDLLLARPDERIGDVMNAEVLSVPVDEEAEEAAEQLAHYDLVELPVVDAEGKLVGVITVDDALDVLLPDEWKPRLPRMFR